MREKILFDENWLFHLGDIPYKMPTQKGPIYTQAKTERFHYGPAGKHYRAVDDDFSKTEELNPETWVTVNLPHDYIIGQEPKEEYNNALGYFKYENAWYRKTFSLSEEDKEKRICLYFEGIATNATIYLNGCLMKHNFCGYNSFEVDITDYVEFDSENVLAVYVDGTGNMEGWWYQGAGIYRHVWLVKTAQVAVDLYGIYVKPRKEDICWNVEIENTIRNDSYEKQEVTVITDIMDGDKVVLSLEKDAVVAAREKRVIAFGGAVKEPQLWSIETPYQYVARTKILCEGEEIDNSETKFGFRTFAFDKENGLFLNGEKIFINGLCAHADFGLTGKAVPDNIQKHKVALMKEMGANGFRCSHYPHSEATMDALDEMGFVVMAETRWFESTEEGIEQLEMLVKRDRNRPSVLFWSVGNEEPKFSSESGIRICMHMMDVVRKLDDTRMIICAVDAPGDSTVYDHLDAIGINYNLNKYDELHEKYPDKMIFASECCATGTTRGWYYDDAPKKGYINAFDKDTTHWFRGRENTWKFFGEREWIVGAYQWTAFEHRGECVWPRLSSQSGAIDLYLQKKDAFYQNQSLFIQDRPILHLLPHWNFEGREGDEIQVGTYTNCEEVELFLNGMSQGRKKVERFGNARWMVVYHPGTILAVGYNNGVPVIEEKCMTTKRPYALVLKQENHNITANGQDMVLLSCYCIDQDGLEVPTATPFVRFTTNSYGTIVGTGSDICDHHPVTDTDRRMRAGRISIVVQAGKQAGMLKVYAEADGLYTAMTEVELIEG